MKRNTFTLRWISGMALLVVALLSAACGADSASQSSSSAPAATDRPVPTMPAARFTAVAQQVYTDTISSDANSNGSQDGTPAPEAEATPTTAVDLSRGQTIYTNRCAECHGAQGEGVADKGGSLTGLSLSSAEFDDAIRTGRNGELGAEHIFGPSAVSTSGLTVLYAYLQSLSEQ